jgi:hypothetical protein
LTDELAYCLATVIDWLRFRHPSLSRLLDDRAAKAVREWRKWRSG